MTINEIHYFQTLFDKVL